MSGELWGVLLGGAITTVSGLLLGLRADAGARARQEKQLQHDRAEHRFDRSVQAYLAFAGEVRNSEAAAERFKARHDEQTYADVPISNDGEVRRPLDQGAEDALEQVRLLLPDVVHLAGRDYLDAHYRAWYDAQNVPGTLDVEAAEAAYLRAARSALGLNRGSA